MKRTRPIQHVRRLRSGKKILINKGFKKKAKIKVVERKIFNHISNPKLFHKEFGGGLDFDLKGDLENFQVIPGTGYEVYLPQDYEVVYHTHPDKEQSPPSPEDIVALLSNDKQQAEMIFRKGQSFTIIKTPLTKKLKKLSKRKLYSALNTIFLSTRGPNWEQDFKKKLEEMGFLVQINNKLKTPIKLKIKPYEPRRRKR